jgi:hypothetical protein
LSTCCCFVGSLLAVLFGFLALPKIMGGPEVVP